MQTNGLGPGYKVKKKNTESTIFFFFGQSNVTFYCFIEINNNVDLVFQGKNNMYIFPTEFFKIKK